MKNITAEVYAESKLRLAYYKQLQIRLNDKFGSIFTSRACARWTNYYNKAIMEEEMIQRIYELEQQLLTPV
jgi:hypothetical protein